MNLILMGSPGVGKGTQSRRLSQLLDIPCISSGDMFREIRKQDSDLAREVRKFMDAGQYVPDELTIKMVLNRLSRADAQKGFILDGFPRTLPQAQALDEALAERDQRIDHVILLEAPHDVVLQRLAGRRTCVDCGSIYNANSNPAKFDEVCDVCGGRLEQRSDDAPEVQLGRLRVYAHDTEPVLDYYRGSGRLRVIDAQPALDEVTDHLMEMVGGVTPA